MPESQRLSTLVGISRANDRVWPLNAALIAFGGIIVWIVFRYLTPDDPRWLYNPWFYAIITPIGLFALSIALGTLVSRLVERSVQLAFLLSMIVHLVLLVFAVDIVIVSRLWPDVFENIQRQRLTLKKQQEIPKYYNLAATSLGNRRPDYLRYVPTKHRPSEIQSSDSRMLQLARSERAQLASPDLTHQSSAKPHLIQREHPSLTMPQSAQEAAHKSRSQLANHLEISRLIESIQPVQPSRLPEPVQAADADVARGQQGSNLSPALELGHAALEPPPSTRPEPNLLARAESQRDAIASELSIDRPQRSRQMQSPLAPAQNIDTSFAAPASSSSRAQSELAPQEPIRGTKSIQSPALNDLSATAESKIAHRVSQPNLERAATNHLEIPVLISGDSENSVRAKTAGGQTGPAAALATPVPGLPSMASTSPAPNIAPSALSDLASRKTALNRINSRMPVVGLSRSPEWSQSPTFSDGTRGAAAVSLPDRADSGQAPKTDIAGLVGDDSPLARSARGLVPTRSSASLPTAIAVADIEGIAGLILKSDQNPSDQDPHPLSAQEADLARSNQSQASVLSGNLPQSAVSSETLTVNSFGAPPLLRSARESKSPIDYAVKDRASDIPRQRLENSTESEVSSPVRRQSKIEGLPADSNVSRTDPTDYLSPATSELSRRGSSAPIGQIMLAIEAEAGQGGVADDPNSRGSLLARNDDTTISLKVTELESSRFAKKDIGGPLAPGINVLVPKPAFQQRIDRLNDESRGHQALVGPQTEIAIERGLVFLAKHQRADGSWRLQDFDSPVLIRSDTAAIGLSLLAFQGAGYTHKQLQHAQVVDRALRYLVEHQLPDGDLYIPQDPASDQNAWLYSHSIATLALCEAYGMTQDSQLREPAQKAVQFMVATQDPQRGGWRYRPGVGTDTSVTGWFTMALKSAQLAGLEVPEQTFERLRLFLDASRVSDEQPHLFRYNPFAPDTTEQRHGLQPTAVMTSVGLLMRLYFGWRRDQPEMIKGADHLLENPPQAGTRSKTLRDTYYWYYATQVLFHMGGDRWKKWHSHLHPILIEDQISEGEWEGSWDPFEPTADLWARYGGRLYVTTMNLLSLEVNYRHLPLYEATAK